MATACPAARATAIAIEFEDSFATAIAFKDAFLAFPVEAFPVAHSLAIERAFLSRSSGFSLNSGKTFSTQLQAQLIN